MKYSFTKHFGVFGIDNADYYTCINCGFSLSATHCQMGSDAWETLNYQYHEAYQGKDFNPVDPRWIERLECQADVIADAAQEGLLPQGGSWLDYACGDGKLADLLSRRHDLRLLKYDRYMAKEDGYLKDENLAGRRFDFVVTTSVFEHFTKREDFDRVNALVSAEGVMGIHTLVCETIPADPAWFYFLPIHCAFHTNRSMSILLEQWGYTSSVYNVDARLWLCYKGSADYVEKCVAKANARTGRPVYIFNRGFVDYWK